MGQVGGAVRRFGRETERTRTFAFLVGAGLVVYGGVHLVIAWLFVQVAWGVGASGADRPIEAMARSTVGQVALWLAAAGMAMLVAWRIVQLLRRTGRESRWRAVATFSTRLFEAAIYVLIGISAAQAALTGGRRGSVEGEGQQEQSLGTAMLQHPWSRILLGAIALALLALGLQLLRSGVTRSFTGDLGDRVPPPVLWAGTVGTCAKGVAVVIVSALVGWATLTFDPSKTAGLEAMIRTLREPLLGKFVLTVIGVGLACYGGYCFAWAGHLRR